MISELHKGPFKRIAILSAEYRMKGRYIFFYAVIGLLSSALLFIITLFPEMHNSAMQIGLILVLPVFLIIIGLIVAGKVNMAAWFVFCTQIIGCHVAVFLELPAFSTFITIFIFSNIFVLTRHIQFGLALFSICSAILFKYYIESGFVEFLPIQAGHYAHQTLLFSGVFFVSILAYSYVVFTLVRHGLIDSDKLKRTSDKLYALAHLDPLTGIYNRRHFIRQGQLELIRARKNRTPLALLLADLDNLKKLNDQHGHVCGDRALMTFATTINARLGADFVFARIGGDEFAILMPATEIRAARLFAEDYLTSVKSVDFRCENRPEGLSMSAGIAMMNDSDVEIDTLLHRADVHLYQAKKNHRGEVVTG
ncbi:MAG: GGDEF domain-containing protein [Leptospiraceae bacterium]|nr:GGDEF domain-containing protein [Leptospiraceae bacterium]